MHATILRSLRQKCWILRVFLMRMMIMIMISDYYQLYNVEAITHVVRHLNAILAAHL